MDKINPNNTTRDEALNEVLMQDFIKELAAGINQLMSEHGKEELLKLLQDN